ncbi:MAG: PilW family protein [Acidobacteriota bacterium]
MSACSTGARARRHPAAGFTLIEMIVVTLLLMIAMLGLLAVFDASSRINKSETDVADAQGNVRYGVYQMTKVIRMAGAGGLFITQAVINANANPAWPGINVSGFYNNITSGTIDTADGGGSTVTIRPGTDMIEIRGVILSPLIGFDQSSGCGGGGCTGTENVLVKEIVGDPLIGEHLNDDSTSGSPQRPQFTTVDTYTASVTGTNKMYVVVEDGNSDLHTGCSPPPPSLTQRFAQPFYNVGAISVPTTLRSPGLTFGPVAFGDATAMRYNPEMPSVKSTQLPAAIGKVRRAGIMDDIIFFIGMLPTCGGTPGPGCDPLGQHPYLAQGIRRGNHFEVSPLADDVEDLQIAYGVDTNGDFAVTRLDAKPYTDPFNQDPNVSTTLGGDEWQPNVAAEPLYADVAFQSQNPFPGSNEHPGIPPAAHCPRLRGVMVSLLAKAHDPDPNYRGPGATGFRLMDVLPASGPPITAVPGRYRRRVQTIKINLRNYEFQG